MNYLKVRLIKELIAHFGDDDRRIDHALTVTYWAERILDVEGGDRDIVLAVGLLHDVGIKPAEAEHGYNNGKLQEQYGPPIVREIMQRIGYTQDKIDEACAIVGSHHTPTGVPGRNFPILWDADMIVNLGDEMPDAAPEKLASVIEKSFKTAAGRELAKGALSLPHHQTI
ncbi:MAG: HD domain-containing protein [Armatimonadota bacterium]|nr:HD domain-containing protein [bacterium]